ncbi:prepilin-type N-terminal cleavage/methylation domain-containing protein [Shewanella canadensis]|uniref:Prepilin-type N-terminal cleavage/methylation domain-containing protein n=1 Tax=Shewanella canadensis TaxID=271096 RepID=A0A3S0J945_9GAMM|nr:prepilin-type N-terminal cleavage/methylation domain-containing protein [Shewanella canadensis]RTR40472.1 prepilin-type N-terminal cleavage/methylation domain-containing protein [Shewanella canadensis]
MSALKQLRKSAGFTLVEMVMVIIILGILVLGVSSFVILGTRIFVESTSVDQVLSQSRFAIERMTREIRNAVPNSLRVTQNPVTFQCIEFVPIQSSASYITLPIAPEVASKTGIINTPSLGINTAHRMLVYPLTPTHIYSASDEAIEGRLLRVKEYNGATNTVTFGSATEELAMRFSEASPRNRFFMINNAVSYCFFTNGDVRRYEGYSMFNTAQPAPADMGDGVLMAEDVVIGTGGWPVSYTPGSLTNNAVVQLTPKFAVNGQEFQYQHQVQVVNVP